MPNITTMTVVFGHGIKREEYGPTKKAEVSITVSVDETDDGAAVLDQISSLAMAKVADMLSAPRPDTANASASIQQLQPAIANDSQEQPHPGWISFSIDGRYAYPDGGAVIDTKTKKVAARIPTSEKLIEVDFLDGKPVKTGHR